MPAALRCGAFITRRDTRVPDLLVFGGSDAPARVLLNDGTGHFRDGAMLPQPPAFGRPALGGMCRGRPIWMATEIPT